MLLLAHASHYLWTLYIPPVLIVVFSIVKTLFDRRREDREEEEASKDEQAGP